MQDGTTKPCSKCNEQIPLGAARCPKCQSWQSIWAFVFSNPQSWIGLLFVPIAFLPMYWMFYGGEDFAKHREEIEVVESKMHIEGEQAWRGLVTVGRLRNNSSVKWRDVVIEVQFFNKNGELVGAKSERDMNLVLLPGNEHAFQVSTSLDRAPETYASHKVYIRDARDASKWP